MILHHIWVILKIFEVADLTEQNPHTSVGVNPSKFVMCIISLRRYLDYCT